MVRPCTSFYTDRSLQTRLYSSKQEEPKEESTSEPTNTQDVSKGVTADAGNNVADILNSPVFLKRKIDVLKSDIAELDTKIAAANAMYEANKAEWGGQLEKLQNEYGTIQERFQKQRKDASGQATIEVARKILDTLAIFDRAFGFVTASTEEEKAVEASYKESYDMILDTFKNLGIQEIETVGAEFNFEVHQAVMMKPSDEYSEGIVMEELAKGYKMEDGKLIRPAMVVVAA
jgi:molecular chaperone GrpE